MLSKDALAAHLATIASRLESILSQLKDDVAEIKARMDDKEESCLSEINLKLIETTEGACNMLEVANEKDAQVSLEEEELEYHGEMKNAELEQKLINKNDTPKFLCGNSHQDAHVSPEEEELEYQGEKNAELVQKLFNRDDTMKLLCGNSQKDQDRMEALKDMKQLGWSFQKASRAWMDANVELPAKQTEINSDFRIPNSNEAGQPPVEWLIAWHNNSLLCDLRTSRLSGLDALIRT